MCTVSMIMDHYNAKWSAMKPTLVPAITPEEIQEFRDLLARAREYDRRHDEPDCELAEKKERLRQLAGELGVPISFV